MSAPIALPDNPRILFLRQDRIGDVFVSTPVVRAVRNRYPHAEIHFLVSRNNIAAGFALRQFVNKIVVLKKSLPSMAAMLVILRRTRYDLVIDLNHTASTTSVMLRRAAKASTCIALQTGRDQATTHAVPQGDRSVRHIVDVLCDLTLPLGFSIPEHDRRPIVKLEERVIETVSPKVRKGKSGKVLGVQISGSSVDRMYPAEAMIEAIRLITAHHTDVAVVVLSAPSEESIAQSVAQQTGARHITPGSTYEHFAAAIASCDWLVSPDTAAIHVAAAHNIPCVVLFSRDHRGYLNWLPYQTYCDPVITDSPSLATISPATIADKVIAMISG